MSSLNTRFRTNCWALNLTAFEESKILKLCCIKQRGVIYTMARKCLKRSLKAAEPPSIPIPRACTVKILFTFSVRTRISAAFVSNGAPPAGKAPATALRPITRLITESSDWTTDYTLAALSLSLWTGTSTSHKCNFLSVPIETAAECQKWHQSRSSPFEDVVL